MKKLLYILLVPLMLFSASKKKSYHLNETKIVNPMIVIDPGHGGKDDGTCGKNPYCKEKRLALQTAILIEKHLKQLGYKNIVLTRRTDSFIPLSKRVQIANSLSCDLFISVHYNSCPTSAPSGIEIHYTEDKKNKKRSKASKKLAQLILDKMVYRTKARNRGLKTGKLYVTRNTEMPSVLIEGGFLTNEIEKKNINTWAYRDKIAKSVAEGINKFLRQ